MSPQPLTVEIDIGSFSSLGRPPDQTWMVRIPRTDRSVIVAIGLSQTAADHLAAHIAELVHDPTDTQAGPTSPTQARDPSPDQENPAVAPPASSAVRHRSVPAGHDTKQAEDARDPSPPWQPAPSPRHHPALPNPYPPKLAKPLSSKPAGNTWRWEGLRRLHRPGRA